MPQAQAQPARVAGGGGGGEPHMGWWVAGGMLVVLILVVAWPILRPDQVAPPAGGPGGANPAAGMSSVDLTTMTPREAADRLFNRVMGAAENGDTLTVQSFLPMSISAYEQAKPLDTDGMYHLSILQRLGGDAAGALATAEEVLADNPDHLLNLAAAAQAARELGDDAKARQYYQHMLDVWETQMASGNDDYAQHTNIMDTLHGEAQTYLAGG